MAAHTMSLYLLMGKLALQNLANVNTHWLVINANHGRKMINNAHQHPTAQPRACAHATMGGKFAKSPHVMNPNIQWLVIPVYQTMANRVMMKSHCQKMQPREHCIMKMVK